MISYKYMRIIVMYDLPNNNYEENKQYTKFRKLLIKNGYIMMQFSIYSKCLNVKTKFNLELNKIKKFIPTEGNIRILQITERQYQDMIYLKGESNINESVNGPQRFVSLKD